jgi:PAS domain S-box-containing protein
MILVVVYVIALLAYGFWSNVSQKKEILEDIDTKLYNNAIALKYMLPDDIHDRAIDPQAISINEDKYIANKLTKLVNEAGFKYTYTIIKREGKLFFIVSDIVADPENERGTFYYYEYENPGQSFIDAFEKDIPTYITVVDKWGVVRTAIVPEMSPGGIKYLACVDYDIGYVNKLLRKNSIKSILTILFFLVLALPIIRSYTNSYKEFHTNLSESEDRYRLMAENVADVIWTMDMNLKYTYISPSIQQLRGYTAEEAMSQSVQEITPNSLDGIFNLLSDKIGLIEAGDSKGLEPVTFELEQNCANGEKIWTHNNARILTDPDSRPISILGTTRDITTNVLAEKSLKESEDKYRNIVQYAPTGIYEFDMENLKFTSVNDVMCEFTGYSESDFLKLNPFDLLTEKSKEVLGKLIENVFANTPEELAAEYKMKGKNQKEFWVLVNSKFFYEEGIPKRAMAVVHDLTNIRRAEEERRRLEIQLQQNHKMEAIGTLAGGIAHDFNNILSGIIGYTQLAEMDLDNSMQLKKHLRKIAAGIQRASALVEQILTFSRQTDSQNIPTTVSVILKEVLSLIRSSIPVSIEINKNITTKAKIMADPTQIHQVIMNLCTNAYQSMSKTGGILTVGLHEIQIPDAEIITDLNMPPGKYLKLEIGDNGYGMEEKILMKIFDPYFTTKEKVKGTGLGLSTVNGIVQKHKGFIQVNSKIGEGTIFQVYLPVLEDDELAELPEKNEEKVATGTESIMLVDDENDILDTLKALLVRIGYKVSTFNNGESAFKAFINSPKKFDLIITDMTMPRMTGDKLSQEILKTKADIPIIICTGYHDSFTEEEAMAIGIKSYVQKPVRGMELSKIIRDLLDVK